MDLLDKLIVSTNFTRTCWIWTGACNNKGYGSLVVEGSRESFLLGTVHVVAWELLVEPVEGPLQLDHLCLNKPCWNPDHLEPVDALTNQRRRQGWYQTSDGSWFCKNDHEISVTGTYRGKGNRVSCRLCTLARRRGY